MKKANQIGVMNSQPTIRAAMPNGSELFAVSKAEHEGSNNSPADQPRDEKWPIGFNADDGVDYSHTRVEMQLSKLNKLRFL